MIERTFLYIVFPIVFAQSVFAHPTYIGRSGAPGLQSCAASCHGLPGGTITLDGFPTSYTPDSTYLLTISHSTGVPIKNFNASCRIGTSTATAGVIEEGTGTSTYGIPAEPNGIHLSQLDLNTANFFWTAPEVGTGTVRFYLAGHQGPRNTGPNTNLILIAEEEILVFPPEPVSNPNPMDMQADVALDADLTWDEAPLAEWYEVYFGTDPDPPFVSAQIELHVEPGELLPGTTYYWKVVAVNGAGQTESDIWEFTTIPVSAVDDNPAIPFVTRLDPAYPNPFNADVTIPFALSQPAYVTISIFNVLGQETVRLAEQNFSAGSHAIHWNAGENASGLYFVKFETVTEILLQKIVSMK